MTTQERFIKMIDVATNITITDAIGTDSEIRSVEVENMFRGLKVTVRFNLGDEAYELTAKEAISTAGDHHGFDYTIRST